MIVHVVQMAVVVIFVVEHVVHVGNSECSVIQIIIALVMFVISKAALVEILDAGHVMHVIVNVVPMEHCVIRAVAHVGHVVLDSDVIQTITVLVESAM